MSTSKKDLKLKLMPQMADLYIDATREVFGKTIFVAKKDWGKFYTFEKKLVEANILPRDYAFRLLKHLKGWTLRKGWKHLPVNVFLGKWAVELYLKDIGNRKFVYVTDDEDYHSILVAEEYKVIMFAEHERISVRAAAQQLWPLMGEYWRQAYENGNRQEISEEASRLYIGVVDGCLPTTAGV